MGDADNIRVGLRVRALVQSERDRGCQEAVQRTKGAQQVTVYGTEAFTFSFNYVFDALASQEEVYNECVVEMLDKLFCGFNATILAYGQTGSGKTYTMGTAFNGEIDENVGVIPRAMNDIFERAEKLSDKFDFVVSCSFMELYQEQLYDLLTAAPREESIVDIREDRNGIVIPNITEKVVKSALETTDCLVRGSSGRAVAATAMNQQSSRSHAIFTLIIQATDKSEMKTVTTSKFHLVDLAGSERSKKTQATGDRFKEGVKINQGLLALGNVISALGSEQGTGFVRYRDSKLTRLLQDSLGGNSITLMIACVSPADYNVAETLSTLRYADRARKIKNKPIVNQDPHAAEINHLKGIIQKLRIELLAAGGGMTSSLTGAVQDVTPILEATQVAEVQSKAYLQLQDKYHNLQQQMQIILHDMAENEMRTHMAEASHDAVKTKMVAIKKLVCDLKCEFAENVIVEQIRNLVDGLDEELEQTQSEIDEHKRRCSMGPSRCEDDEQSERGAGAAHEVHLLMQEQADAYANKQIDFKEQLRRINRELNLKEELHQRVEGNFNKFCTLDDKIDEKYKDCELKIHELETEKLELLDKLRHVKENPSAKLAEERRRRLQALEQEITDMKRKNTQQAKLLKVREKETQKIQNLNTEIQAMKESKVKLIRAMRLESENFRQWKLTREKELMQLKNKSRKRENEMVRKEALHNKQRNVLKRKCEEAMAINKRLKDALERQRVAQSQRQKLSKTVKDASVASTKIDQVIASAERELEVIISLIDAEHSLEQLMEDRSIISSRILELQREQPSGLDSTAGQELENLQEDLDMRNAQITDLQQKVCAADLEARMRKICDNIQNIGEAQAVLSHLLKAISEMRRENANRSLEQKSSLEELRSLLESAEMRCNVATKRMRLMEIEHEEVVADRENTYEEKIAVLLRELHNAPQASAGVAITPEQEECIKIQEEQLNRMDALREELESYKKLVTDLQASSKTKSRKKENYSNKEGVTVDYVELESSDSENFTCDSDNDPDWVKTPQFRKLSKRNNITNTLRTSSNSSKMDDTYTTAASGIKPNAAETGVGATAVSSDDFKRKSKGCSCRGNCDSKRCGCRSSNEKCAVNCRCSNSCNNGKHADSKDRIDVCAGKEISISTAEETNDATFTKPEGAFLTPKIARLSTISFVTTSAKKKFFN